MKGRTAAVKFTALRFEISAFRVARDLKLSCSS
jgi:hypothetical protein